MKPITTIRGRLAGVPAAVRRRSDSSSARSTILADARAVSPDIPRDADSGHLIRAARRLVRRAAQDEFAREGVNQVRLPDGWGRAELRRADVPGEATFRSFVEEMIGALDITPSVLERDDAVELLSAPTSSDRYGLSPEVAADLASYLLGRAFDLDEEATDADGFFATQASRVREDVRATLVRQVKVPLELKVALDRHERIESGQPPRVEDFASPAGGPDDEDATEAERQGFAARAQAAYGFAQSEAGRAAFSMLRTGAEKAYEMYGHREGDGKTPKPGPKTRSSSKR